MLTDRTISRIMSDPTAVSGVVVTPESTGRVYVTAWARYGEKIASPQAMYGYARQYLRHPVRVSTGGESQGGIARTVTSVYTESAR